MIEDRTQEVEQKFNIKQSEREAYLSQAEECLAEMHRLQGEYRLLQVLTDDKAAIEAAPEETN